MRTPPTYKLITLAASLAAALWSCGHHDGPAGMTEEDNRNICLKFNISADGIISGRNSSGTDPAERIILTGDTRIYLYDENDRLITSTVPADTPSGSGNNDGYYSITVAVSPADIGKLALTPDGHVRFRIAIAANMQGLGSTLPESDAGTPYSDLDPVFEMSPSYYPSTSTGIPMFGTSVFSVRKSSLMVSSPKHPLAAGELTLTRSLCRVEVKNSMTNSYTASDGQSYPQINSVRLLSWNSKGYLRSDIPSSDLTARVLEQTAIEAVPLVETDNGLFRTYIPEGNLNGPELILSVTRSPGSAPEEFSYPLSKAATTFGTEFLIRNCIYTFEVTSVGVTADLTAGVRSWIPVESTFDYPEKVIMTKYPVWDISGSDSDFRYVTTGTDIPMLYISTSGRYVSADFAVEAPEGSVWTAQLIPGMGGIGAFEFVNADTDGNAVGTSAVSSGHTGTPSSISLRAVTEEEARAELMITVRTPGMSIFPLALSHSGATRIGIIRQKK